MCLFRQPDIVKKVWHSCPNRLLPKICLNYKYLLLSSPWHLEGQIRQTRRTFILLGKSEEEKELIDNFKRYSSLGDDLFLCRAVCEQKWIQFELQKSPSRVLHLMAKCKLPFSKAVKSDHNYIFDILRIIPLNQQKFSQSDPVLIRQF